MSSVVSSKITGKEYPLSKIFSSDFEYHIPGYQRPYAWTEDETGALFDDLYGFFQTENTEIFFWAASSLSRMNRTAMPMSSMDSSA